MPIDPNIALNVRPIEQPNMLGQMAQVMAMRQAQQAYESENALRDFYSQGGDASTAEGRRRLMAASPTAGIKLIGQQSEIAARDLGSTEKAIKLYKDQVGSVTDPTSAASLLKAVYSNPLTRPFVESMAPLDKALSNIPTDAAGLEQWKRGFGLTADKLFVDANTMATNQARIQAAGIGAGPGHRQASVAEQRFKNELDFGGETKPFLIQDPNDPSRTIEVEHRRDKRTGQWVPMAIQPPPLSVNVSPSSATAAPIAPVVGGGGGGGVVNNLTPNAINAPNVNALNPNTPVVAANVPNPALAVVRGGAPTLTEIANPNNPMETMRVDARVYKGGGPDAPGVLGIVKTGNLNPAQQLKVKTEMAKDFKAVDKTIAETNALLEAIDAVRNSNLERVAGPIDARTFTMTDEGKMAETRFESLKGKVTAIAKAASTMTGAIGSIANQEWQILANQIAVLDLKNGKDPSLEQIDQLERQAMSIVNRMREGFSRQYGEYVDELGPQYKELPNVTYTPGSAGYTPKGQKRPAQSSATPASTGNITTNPTIDTLLNKYK